MTFEATSFARDPQTLQRDALTAAAAVTRACAWGLTPAVEALRRVGLPTHADELSGVARALTQLADDLAVDQDANMTLAPHSDPHPAFADEADTSELSRESLAAVLERAFATFERA